MSRGRMPASVAEGAVLLMGQSLAGRGDEVSSRVRVDSRRGDEEDGGPACGAGRHSGGRRRPDDDVRGRGRVSGGERRRDRGGGGRRGDEGGRTAAGADGEG